MKLSLMIKGKGVLAAAFLSLGLIAPATADLCSSDEETGYVVGFFNGVWNTEIDAIDALAEIKGIVGDTYNDERIRYEYFYNATGPSHGATMFEDIAETFIQRAEEIDPNLAGRFDLFWSAVHGKQDGYWAKIRSILSGSADLVVGLLNDLYDWGVSQSLALISNLFSSPPTMDDYAEHRARLNTLALHGEKLVLVAHSQGNLFANNAYGELMSLSTVEESHVGLVHIAPASPQLNGDYTLADIDLVINALRATGTVPDNNIFLPLSHLKDVDASGHTLMTTYLHPDLSARSQIFGQINSALDRIEAPEPQATTGSFTVTLTWDGSGDVDLHTFEPGGSHVYYGNRRGEVGELDVDNIVGRGPEHYFASCDYDTLQAGTYFIGLNNYSWAEGRTATVQLSTPSIASVLTRSMMMGPSMGSNGDANPAPIMNVVVDKSDGRVTVSAY